MSNELEALQQERDKYKKALKLIKEKNVDVNEIRHNSTAKNYNSKISCYRQNLIDDEFKFLKETIHRLG